MKKILFISVICLLFTIFSFGQSEKFPNDDYIIKKIDIDGPIIEQTVYSDYYKGTVYKYKTIECNVGDLQMCDAIKNNNVQLVKQLIEYGYDITLPIFLQDFSDYETANINWGFTPREMVMQICRSGGCTNNTNFYFNSKDGYLLCSVCPTRAIKTTALDYAKKINDAEIISILSTELENREAQKIIQEKQEKILK